MCYLGIDCGGSSTQAVLVNAQGQVLAGIEGGPANYSVDGPKRAAGVVDQVFRQALAAAALAPGDVRMIGLGVSGAGRPVEQDLLAQELAARGLSPAAVTSDAEIALWGAHIGGPGVIIIAGTGSLACGRNEQGRFARAGGWGYLVDDAGSAFWIASRLVGAALRSWDGRSSRDLRLEAAIKEFFGVSEPPEIIPRIYQQPIDRRSIARFAATAAQLAEEGHQTSRMVFAQAGRELAKLAVAVLRRLEQPDLTVAYWGGAFTAGKLLLEPMREALGQEGAPNRLKSPSLPAAAGAILWALAEHTALDSRFITNLTAGCRERGWA